MTISVVQTVAAGAPSNTNFAANFGSNVTAGNSIILVVTAAANSNAAISSSNPTFGGAAPPGSVKLAEADTGGGSNTQVYEAIWLMPAVAGGASGVAVTVTGSVFGGGAVGLVAYEVAGLGAFPVLDKFSTATGTGSSATSGASGATTAAPEIIVASLLVYGQSFTTVGAPWTESQFGSDFSVAGYQVATSSGGSYTYAQTASGAAANVGVIVTVAAGGPPPPPENPVPPPVIPPHPHFTGILLEQAWARADWQAQGVADLTVTFALSSGGIDTYNVTSPWNGTPAQQPQQMRVLPPAAPNRDYPHAFLVMLPVEAGLPTTFGDPVAIAQSLTANDKYNLTCVMPGYSAPPGGTGPWFADNPLSPAVSQEKYTLLVAAWIRAHLATSGGEKVYLIGFSRSGLGGQGLFFRHPDLFAAVASWDAPFMMTDYDGSDPYGTSGGNPDTVYGTSVSFKTNYELDTHLAGWQATGQYGVSRIWIGQGPAFADTPHYDAALTAAGIPHAYTFSNTGETHAWQPDWVAAALAAVIPSSYAQAATVLPQQIPRPLFTQLVEVAAWRLPGGPPPPAATTTTAAGSASAAATVTAAATQSAAAASAGAGSATAVAAQSAGAAAAAAGSAGPAPAVQAAIASAAAAAAATAAGSVSGPASGTAQAAAAATTAAIVTQIATASAAGRASGTGTATPPFTVGFLTAATQRTGGPGG